MRVLIMGLPGSGKTTIGRELAYHFCVPLYNADTLRDKHNDWDFTEEGRMRQAYRMSFCEFGIMDFICPLKKMRKIVDADFVIWLDTIKEGRFEDTNKVFEEPTKYNIRVTEHLCLETLRKTIEKYKRGIHGLEEYLNDASRLHSLLIT